MGIKIQLHTRPLAGEGERVNKRALPCDKRLNRKAGLSSIACRPYGIFVLTESFSIYMLLLRGSGEVETYEQKGGVFSVLSYWDET